MANPAAEAAAAQAKAGYHADTWLNVVLHPMTKVWQGIGGYSAFFLSEVDAREATGAYEGSRPHKFAETLWRAAQVEPNPTLSYRQGIREYVVDLPTQAACAICLSNTHLGNGTVFQYYIPNWEQTLYSTGREFKFTYKDYKGSLGL